MLSIYPNLCSEMDKANIDIITLAGELNISDQEVRDKMSGAVPWFLDEALIVGVLLKNTDLEFLFIQAHNK